MKPDTRFLGFAFTVTFVLVSLKASTVTAIPFDALILQSPTVSGTGIDHPPRADIDIPGTVDEDTVLRNQRLAEILEEMRGKGTLIFSNLS
jgi:hypothetical protein